MASIKVEITQNFTESVEITNPIIIGRSRESDLLLLDELVSRQHARIYMEGREIIIEDLNSANGMFVNGNRVFLRALQDEDVVQIGKTRMYYSAETWDKAPFTVDLTRQSIDTCDINSIIDAPDVLLRFFSENTIMEKVCEIIDQKLELVNDLSSLDKNNLATAVKEGIGNAQRHGHKYNPDLPIEFRCIQKPERLVMQITDQGPGFDYRKELREKKDMDPIEAARIRWQSGGYGGLGIIVMLRCVHKVEYNRKGNQITLTKFFGEAARRYEEQQKIVVEQGKKIVTMQSTR